MSSRELEAVDEVEGTVAFEVGWPEEEGRVCVFEDEDDDDVRMLVAVTGYLNGDDAVAIGRGQNRARRACIEGGISRVCTCII